MNAIGGKIVVGVDGSEHSDRALTWAIEEAGLRRARIHIVTAWHIPAMIYGGPGFTPQISASVDETFREVAEEVSAAAAEKVRSNGIDGEARVVRAQAADALVEAAEGADLLVVGSRGHGGFTGLLLGSVSAQCAHHAPCSLVIVR
jgi:nucleotide-binding universal stress UspA family protein